MILLCDDGSDDAKAAADHAARPFPHAPVTVLAVWERYVEMITQSGFGLAYTPAVTHAEEIDAAVEEHARVTAQEGAERLRHAGITVQSCVEARAEALAHAPTAGQPPS